MAESASADTGAGGAGEALPTWLGAARLGVGLVQGLAGYALYLAQADGWADDAPALYGACVLATAFVPLVIIGGLGALRPVTLAAWSVAAALLTGVLGWHDRFRQIGADQGYGSNDLPAFGAFLAAGALIYIVHHLIAASDASRKPVAPYGIYFDLGWRHGAQLVLAAIFTGALWLILWLAAALFSMIEIDAFRDMITSPWFGYPVTTVAFAAAVHVTDLRSKLVHGVRTLALTLLSWLTPIFAGLIGIFVIALPFAGFDALWSTQSAAATLLSAAAVLIVLINAAYQDGGDDVQSQRAIRWAVRAAAVLLAPLVGLAIYAIYLRTNQYGLTPARVSAIAAAAVAASYGLAYAVAAFGRRWMKLIEIANVVGAYVVVAILASLFTPIADPARIAVADQLRRLEAERVSVAEFDFHFLRFDSARYGLAALDELAAAEPTDERAELIAERAAVALETESSWSAIEFAATPEQRREAIEGLRADITVHPAGAALPESFLEAIVDAESWFGQATSCENYSCDARTVDIDADGDDEILIAVGFNTSVYRLEGAEWSHFGDLDNPCSRNFDLSGEVDAVPPEVSDVEIDGVRHHLINHPGVCGD